MKIELFVALEIQYFLTRTYTIKLLALSLELVLITCARSFNPVTRAFSLLTRGFELVTHGFELITCGFEHVNCEFELVAHDS